MPRSDTGADGSAPSFGPNAPEVMKYLAELRGFDWDRALQVWDARAAVDPRDLARALQAAAAVGEGQRPDEWLLAREAATVLARSELGDSPGTEQVLDILADVSGAIAVRDLLPARDFELVLLPWTSRAGAVAGRATAPAPVAAGRRRPRVKASLPAVMAILALIAVGTVFAALNRPTADLAALGGTAAPPSSPPRVGAVVSPALSTPAGASSPTAETDAPTSSVGPTIVTEPTARPTRRPAVVPGPEPTPKATTVPAPATPTPTPKPMCTVISLIDTVTAQAQFAWNDAGFSGTVTFSPSVPPHYKIEWQSLEVGRSVACTRGITVRSEAL